MVHSEVSIRRHFLSKKEVKALLRKIEWLNSSLRDLLRQGIEEAIINDRRTIVHKGSIILIELEDGTIIPSLKLLYKQRDLVGVFPRVFVDKGAVPHIINGANIMAPGVTKVEGEFREGDIVVVVAEDYNAPICVGRAVHSSDEVRSLRKGKVVVNLHHLKDKYWSTSF